MFGRRTRRRRSGRRLQTKPTIGSTGATRCQHRLRRLSCHGRESTLSKRRPRRRGRSEPSLQQARRPMQSTTSRQRAALHSRSSAGTKRPCPLRRHHHQHPLYRPRQEEHTIICNRRRPCSPNRLQRRRVAPQHKCNPRWFSQHRRHTASASRSLSRPCPRCLCPSRHRWHHPLYRTSSTSSNPS